MKRKTSTAPTRIWSYYCRPPTEDQAKLVRETLFHANRYYNQLIELERRRSDQFHQVRRDHAPELCALEEAFEAADKAVVEALDEINRTKARIYQQTGKKTVRLPPELLAPAAQAKAHRKEIGSQFREAKAAFNNLLSLPREELKRRKTALIKVQGDAPHTKRRINEETSNAMLGEKAWPKAWKATERNERANGPMGTERKRLRKSRAVGTQTGALVESSADKAIQDARPKQPRFKRFTGEGRVGGQISGGGCTMAEVMGGHPQLRLRQLPPKGPWRHANEFFIASLNIGSAERRANVWVHVPVRLHRTVPKDAIIKSAWILVRRTGTGLRYELQLTLEAESFHESKRPAGEGRVSINFGWRELGTGLRVAYWVADSGKRGQIIVPHGSMGKPGLADRVSYHKVLDSIADQHLVDVKRAVSKWLHLAGNHWPKHVVGRTWSDQRRLQFVHAVRDFADLQVGREELVDLWGQWKTERTTYRQHLFCPLSEASAWAGEHGLTTPSQKIAWWLEIWARQDRHLRQYEACQRVRGRRQRDAFYRAEAIRLATQFGTLVIDNTTFSTLARRPEADEVDEQHEKARENRHAMAPGKLRQILREVFGPKRAIVVDAQDNSALCHSCGKKLAQDESTVVACPTHGRMDVDENNCLNLLRRAKDEGFGGDEPPAPARKPKSSGKSSGWTAQEATE